jgi:rod shape-determining protein MreC
MGAMALRLTSAAVVAGLLALWVCRGTRLSRLGREAAVGAGAPFLAAVATGTHGAERLWGRIYGSGGQALADAQRRVVELEVTVAELRCAARERDELRSLLELPGTTGWQVIFAPVIARDVLDWGRGFRLGKGRSDGIVTGAAVVVGDGVVGRVAECTEHTALVAALGDAGCRIGVQGASGAWGIVSGASACAAGEPAPRCAVRFLARETNVAVGAVLRTSGLGQDMPEGLLVGRVVARDNGVDPTAEIRAGRPIAVVPVASADACRYVGVVVPARPQTAGFAR